MSNDYNYKEDSIAWEAVKDKKGKPLTDFKGEIMYQSIPVPSKGKGNIFCPYCDKYKNTDSFDVGYGLKEKGCKECNITMKDFHMKRVNSIK